MLQIQEALTGLKEPIIEENRMFIEQFIFIKKEIKHQRLFFLFNDVLIIANEKWKVKHILDMRTLDVKIKADGRKKKGLPEFKLISTGAGSVIYVGKDMKDINKFKRLILMLQNVVSDSIISEVNTKEYCSITILAIW